MGIAREARNLPDRDHDQNGCHGDGAVGGGTGRDGVDLKTLDGAGEVTAGVGDVDNEADAGGGGGDGSVAGEDGGGESRGSEGQDAGSDNVGEEHVEGGGGGGGFGLLCVVG